MNPGQIREALKYPALLNIIAALSTLNRIYAWLPNPKLGLWGHFVALAIFALGAVVGLCSEQDQPGTQRGVRWWAGRASYALFGAGALWLVYVLFADWQNFPRE